MKLERRAEKLGDILVEHKMATQEALEAALTEQKKTHERLGEVLVRRGVASVEDVNWALASQFNISYMPISQEQVDPEIVRIIPEDMARRSRLLPLLKVANDLIVVVDDPMQQGVFEDIERLTGLELSICLGKTGEIQAALDMVYGAREEGAKEESSIAPISGRFSKKEVAAFAGQATGADLFDRLLEEVYESGAEALHIDHIGHETIARARINGRLEPWLKLSGDLGAALSTRVRVLAGIGAVSGEGVSGEFKREIDGKPREVSVSILSAMNGESMLLRPHREVVIPPLKDLGFTRAQLAQVRALLNFRRGLIVTTGPRASGKTTTLYSMFHEADPLAEKLVAIEDEPLGASDGGLSLHLTGQNLLGLLHAALAADPDAVLIQPIPSEEVLDLAIREALQSIKVGIQLPFADAASALSFLLSGATPAQAVAGAMAGLIAQRIVRTLCEKCKKPEPKSGLKIKDSTPFRAEGCSACKGTGYAGRTAIFEVVLPDGNLRALLASRPEISAIRSRLSDIGIVTLKDRALKLYAEGLTSAEEIAEFI